MTPHRIERAHDPVWITCATCWGQRQLLTASPGRRLEPIPCPSCLGVGERLSGGDQVPAPV
jgi:hypothetical protein